MTTLAKRFLDAVCTFNGEALSQLLAPDARAWRNIGNRERTVPEVLQMLHVERLLIRSSTVQLRHMATTQDGFVVQFVLMGTTQGGAEFSAPICVVARVAQGRVTRLDEYADEASLQPLWEEFAELQSAADH